MSELVCHACGESEELRGSRRDDGTLQIICDACGTSWDRDTQRRCKLCGSTDLAYSPKPLWEKGRGDQRTPAGEIPSWACYDCGGRDVTSANPRPAAGGTGA